MAATLLRKMEDAICSRTALVLKGPIASGECTLVRRLASAPGNWRIRIVLLAAALVFVHVGSTWAQEEPEALIRQGVELRRQGKDALAQGYFKRAYSIAHTPRSAAQLGLVEQALGYFLDAEQHLDEAMDNGDAWVDQNRALLEQSRALVRSKLVRVQTRGLPGGATVQIPGHGAVPVAADGAVWVSPGPASLTFAAPDHTPVSKDVSGDAGATVALELELQPATAASLAMPPAPVSTAPVQLQGPVDLHADRGGQSSRHVAGVVVAGAGVALAAGGIITYLVGRTKLNAINADAVRNAPYDTANGNYQALGDLGLGLAIAGGAAIASGAVIYLIDRKPRTGAAASVSVGYLPGSGGQIQFGGRF